MKIILVLIILAQQTYSLTS